MKLEQSFEVAAPLDRVWRALIDIEYVAPCLPGAEITGRDEDGSYRGTFSVKLGPTTAAYNGVLKIEDADETAHRATLHARGTDKRGQGGATATIVNTVTEVALGSTRVEARTDFTITGRLARFGRGGMIEDISNRLLRDFSECLAGKLLADEAASAEAARPEPPAASAGTPAPAASPHVPAPPTAGGGVPAQTPPPAPPRPVSAGPTATKPVGGFSLFLSVLWERLRKLLRGERKAR